MQILTPQEVKSGSTIAENETRVRIHDLSVEETRLVSSINSLREDEKVEKARIEADVAEFRVKANAEVAALDSDIVARKDEVEKLEARRAEAMKPIEEIRAEADERNQRSNEREEAVIRMEMITKEASENNAVTLDGILDKEQEQAERDATLDRREERIKEEEEHSRQSLIELNEKWAQLHVEITQRQDDVARREVAVSSAEYANKVRTEELDKETLAHVQKDREIADKYATLERTMKRLGITT